MTTPATQYADRLIDTICECLNRCQAAEDAIDCAQEFISHLHTDPSWRKADTDRVARVVMRVVRPMEPLDCTQRA